MEKFESKVPSVFILLSPNAPPTSNLLLVSKATSLAENARSLVIAELSPVPIPEVVPRAPNEVVSAPAAVSTLTRPIVDGPPKASTPSLRTAMLVAPAEPNAVVIDATVENAAADVNLA